MIHCEQRGQTVDCPSDPDGLEAAERILGEAEEWGWRRTDQDRPHPDPCTKRERYR